MYILVVDLQLLFCQKEQKHYNMTDLKKGVKIQLDASKEVFVIDNVFDDGHVDMTATKPYHPVLRPDYYEKFFSILLKNYKIVEE